MIFLINTFLGFLVAQLYDVFTRSKTSESSPEKFEFLFFLKDTWQKMVVSLLLSVSISILIWLNVGAITSSFGDYADLIYILAGFAPEIILQKAKKKLGILQPKKVEEYNRKESI